MGAYPGVGAYLGVGACPGYYSIVNIMQTLTSFEYSESDLQIYMYVSTCTLISYLQCMTQFVAVQCNVQ